MNPSSAVRNLANGLPAISLAEVLETADLQTRVDRKYLVPVSSWNRLTGPFGGYSALEISGIRQFAYESVYFDTPDRIAYHEHARGRRRRWKVRTRTYLDSGLCALEVKTRSGRGETVKHRADHPLTNRDQLGTAGTEFVSGFLGPLAGTLEKSVTISYQRTTFVDRRGDARITVDTGLEFEQGDITRFGPRLILIETKAAGAPTLIDKILWRFGHRPTSLSKYCIGVALMDPTLAANRWSRVLRKQFDWKRDLASSRSA